MEHIVEDRISALTTKDPEKIKVYLKGIDYKVTIDGAEYHISNSDFIEYDGKEYKADEFYEMYKKLLIS